MDLSTSSPISEKALQTEVAKHFDKSDIQSSIMSFLKALNTFSEFQNYKLFVSATKYEKSNAGPIQTFAGGYWNQSQDGSMTIRTDTVVVTLVWIKN